MNKSGTGSERPRRDALKGIVGLGAAAGLAGSGKVASAGTTVPMRWDDPEWNRDAFAKLLGNLKFGEVKRGWYNGVVCGVREGEAVKPLMGFEGFSHARLIDNGEGSYQKLLRETVYYKDLATGEVLDTYVNPYTDEEVRVVHVTNDPFNHLIQDYIKPRPGLPGQKVLDYGGLRKADGPPPEPRPFKLPWKMTSANTVTIASDIHMYYTSALQPDKWPRESAGEKVRVSELFRYVIRKEDLENPDLTSIEYTGTWSRINPWLPWLLMGQTPGHVFYMGVMGGYNSLDMLSPQVRAYAEKHHPKFFDAPTEWVDPSLSSLENYARTEKPAPPKK